MRELDAAVEVYLYTRPCDMRCGFDTLGKKVEQYFNRRVVAGGLYVFFSRSKDRVKILYWDKDGFALWCKRLEKGVFRISSQNDTEQMSGVDLKLLLEGMDLERIKFRNKCSKGIAQVA